MNAVIDRVVQYPNRWKITNVDTGEVLGTFDFVPEVGTITQVGTKINKVLFDSIKEDIEAKISSDGGDASKAIETFTASNTRTNLVSGETISISMGKIYKWLSDLKALAFKDSLGKADVGLGNVDNTSDKDKPVSDKTQTALDNEAKARGGADKTIQDNISNEVTARTNADTALGERIDTERNTANNEYVKNMLHLGYYDTYTIDTNGNYVVTRQTGYLHITADAPILSLEKLQNGNPELWYSAPGAIFDTASTTDNIKSNWLALGNGTQYQGNYTSVASYYTSQPIVIVSVADATTADQIKTYVSSHPLFIQYKLATSYTETYEPNHFARIEPYALEHAKSEADRSSNLCNTFDRSNIPSTSSLYSATLNPDGSYTSTAIGDYRAWSYSNSDFKFDLEPGTYTLSSIITSSAYMNIFDSNNNGLPHVFTLTSRTSVGIMVKAFTGSAYIMLNRGSVALPYQPYEGKVVHESGLTKSAVGLGNVDNTADKDKPISDKTQAALNDEYVKNMLHLGYYDTYTIDSNGNYVVTRQTGYIRFTAETATDLGFFKQTYSNITRYAKDTTWTELISNADSSSDIGNTTPTKNGCFLSGGGIYVYAKNNDFSGLVIYIQGKTSDSYTETYEPNHFARIEPYALEYAKSEADRSANLMHFLFTASGHNMAISDNLGTSVYTFVVGSTNDPYVETGNIQLKANTRYSVSATNGAIGEWIDDAFYRLSTFTTGSTGIIRLRLTASVSAAGIYTSYIMLNSGSVALPYQPYEGKTVHETGLTKSAVGLSNVDNTADKDKPVSTATQAALKKAQGTTIKVLGNATDFFYNLLLNQYTSPVPSTVIKLELKNAVSLSLQSTYGFAKPILTKAVLVRYETGFEDRYPLVISGLSKRSSDYTAYDGDDYEMFSISETLYNSLTVASDITGTSNWYFLFTFEEME